MTDAGINISFIFIALATIVYGFFNGFHKNCPTKWLYTAFLLSEAALVASCTIMIVVPAPYESDGGFIAANVLQGAFTIMTWILMFEILAVARQKESSIDDRNNNKSYFGLGPYPVRLWVYAYGVGEITASVILTIIFGGGLGRAVLRASTVVYLLAFFVWTLKWPQDIRVFGVHFIAFAIFLMLSVIGSVVLFVLQLVMYRSWSNFIVLESAISAGAIKFSGCLALLILVTTISQLHFPREGAIAIGDESPSQQRGSGYSLLPSSYMKQPNDEEESTK
ncbi:hypothetical protein BDB00DRAFT_797628 [Zychaea mexicana]|uniref:uncharacterized protein n=1 Tax=Zychaea mexicana TaxID=64656 RepID=UPI0022FE6189|nr:uncharacterized protein BDB00DRAFT_797628 [Zychaea mexicana]KAI9498979.1 hypothetical protein BDB00DRAFT_797628 [Zychaea mexicana]